MNDIVGVNVIETPPPLGAAVQPAPTSTTAVLGVFERGRPSRPVRLTGPEQVEAAFGRPTSGAVSALALRLYWLNGGREAVVARVVGAGATPAELVLSDRSAAPGSPALRLRAGDRGGEDPGLWGRRLSATVTTETLYSGALTSAAVAGDATLALADATGVVVGMTLDLTEGAMTETVRVTSLSPAGVAGIAPVLGSGFTSAATTVTGVGFRLRLHYRPAEGASPVLVEDWTGLSMSPDAPSYAPRRLNDPLSGSRHVTAEDLRGAAPAATTDGLAAAPDTAFTGGSEPAPTAADLLGRAADRSGLHAFDRQAVQLLTTPDVHAMGETNRRSAVEGALAWCAARGDCAYIGALPDRGGATSARPQGPGDYAQSEADYVAAIEAYTADFRRPKAYGAFYGPFGATLDPTATGPARLRMIPLDLPVAGIFADVALRRGVFKAPAGAGAQLRGITALSARLSDAQNTRVVRVALANMARRDDLLGLHVATSRTVSTDPRWRFVNVRLLFNFVVASLREGLRGFVHQTHDERLRRRAVSAVTGFLEGLRRRGAFAAEDAARAYRVKSDADNNTPASIARGELIVDVEINPARPAETINLRVGVTPLGVSLTES